MNISFQLDIIVKSINILKFFTKSNRPATNNHIEYDNKKINGLTNNNFIHIISIIIFK